jgi:hypothetical protein
MKNIWDKQKCCLEALKYETRGEFRKKSGSAYNFCLKNKCIDEVCRHMREIKKPKEYWTKDRCQEEALKYSTKTEFIKNSNSAYCKSYDFGWLDDICKHMVFLGNKYRRGIYVYEFTDKYAYVGLTYNFESRKKQHLKRGPVFEHTKLSNFNFKILSDYCDIEISKKLESEYCEKYYNEGWKLLNKAKPGACGGGLRKWTKSICKQQAMEFNDIKDYIRKNKLSYRSAKRNGWLEEITQHMIKLDTKKYKYWTYDRCKEAISKCISVNEFRKKFAGGYGACKKNNWIDELCNKLIKTNIKPKNYWTKDKCKEEALKFKTKKEFRENSISAYIISNRLKIMNEITQHMK